MTTHSPPAESPELRSALDLGLAVRRDTQVIREHARAGKIRSTKVGTAHVFTPDQWEAALAFYARLDARG